MAMAPLTRHRCLADGTPSDMVVDYYRQRAGAGLIITEGTYPSDMGKGYLFIPGLTTPAHVTGWRAVTDAVHEAGGAIFCQLMHCGRLSDPLLLPGGATPFAPSAVQPDPVARHYTINCPRPRRTVPYPPPHAMTAHEVKGEIGAFRHATRLALEAGFDGVEIHAASGYLPMQFLSTNTNLRTDEYGGSIEKRARFLLECVDEMSAVAGPGFVAVKVSPGWTFHNVYDDDAPGTYSHVARELSQRKIAYLQVGNYGIDWDVYGTLRPLFDGPFMMVGGFTRKTAVEALEAGRADMIAFGQAYLANPDLDIRYRQGLSINQPEIDTYYTQDRRGYTDYPVHAAADPGRQVPVDSAPTPISPDTTG